MRLLASFLFACLLVVPSAYAQAVDLTCGDSAQTVSGAPGTTLTVTCPGGCAEYAVWGTGIYSDDSSVCASAIHAGALGAGGGTTTITIAAGQDAYVGTTANGVTSLNWGSWGRSFVFGRIGVLSCYDNAQALAGDAGTSWTVQCPAGCMSGGTVWGTGTYSDDSAVCVAAIHAGVLSPAGGYATVHIAPGLSAYTATTLNGVTTSPWGEWGRSFTFEVGD